MKFQGEILLFCCLFWQQGVWEGVFSLQFAIASFEKPAAMIKTAHNSIKVQKVSISFFICIAVVFGKTNVKTKKLQEIINSVKHIKI